MIHSIVTERADSGQTPGDRKSRFLLLGFGLIWLLGIGSLTAGFMNYEHRPGLDLSVKARWPEQSKLDRSAGKATLIMLAHPQCPCTTASLDELADLVQRAQVPLKVYVLFLSPRDLPQSWTHTKLWEKAREIPGVLPVDDPDGREARLFGGTTSGHVLLYTPEGLLQFSGGITSSRGTRGESAGQNSILASLSHGPCTFTRTPVFGCPLEDRKDK